MSTDLKKMVNKWFEETRKEGETGSDLHSLLLSMAAEIEANREEIEKLKTRQDDLFHVVLSPEQQARYDEAERRIREVKQ